MIGTSNTPLSMMSGDPVIADQSPPFNIGRSQSADIFSTPGEHASLSEDALSLEMYGGKGGNMPFRSPLSENGANPYLSSFSDEQFTFQSPPPSSHKMDLPFRSHEHNLAFQTPTHAQPAQQPQLQSQQAHQDSGVAFTSPLQEPGSQMYHTPKEHNVMLYQDSGMYQSPGQLPESSSNYQTPAHQMHQAHHAQHSHQQRQHSFETPVHQLQNEGQLYPSPLGGEQNQDELDMNHFVNYGTIDPATLQ